MSNLRNQTTILKDIQDLCTTSGYIHVLNYLAFTSFFFCGDKTAINSEAISSQINNPARLIKNKFNLLLGFTIKKKINFSPISDSVFYQSIQKTLNLLRELHECLIQPWHEHLQNNINELTNQDNNISLSGEQYLEPIFYAGDTAYNHQYQSLSIERYKNDHNWLQQNEGFTIDEAQEILQTIFQFTLNRIRSGTIKNIEDAITLFEFNIRDINTPSGLSSQTIRNFVNAFTQPPSPTNENFNALFDINEADIYPILKRSEETYLLFDHYNLNEKIYESPFYWMNEDTNYRNTANKHRGDFTEDMTSQLLKKIFGENNVYQNVNIQKGKNILGEIDVLVIHANYAIIVQCKSKKSTLEARKGKINLLQNDFKKAIQDSYNQGFSCAEALLNNSDMTFELNNNSTIELPKIEKIQLICVIAENYPALLLQTDNFLQYKKTNNINPPLICDIFFIDTITKCLPSPLRFIHYIERRSVQLSTIHATNELVILSAYLQTRLNYKEYDYITLEHDIASFVDTKMLSYEATFKGKYQNQKDFFNIYQGTLLRIILRHIESSQNPDIFNFGINLLDVDLSKDQIKELSKNIIKSQKNAKKNQNHIHPTILQQSTTTKQMFLFLITNKKHIKKGKVEEARQTIELKSGATTIYYIVLNAQNSLPIIPF